MHDVLGLFMFSLMADWTELAVTVVQIDFAGGI